MKKFIYIGAVILVMVLSLETAISATENKYTIGVLFWHESAHDNITFEGIKEGLEEMGIDCQLDVKRAYGDEEEVNKIVDRWKNERPDLIFTIGTGATIRTMKTIKDIPIVFTAVMNPVAVGITPNWETSGSNVAGNSNWIPTDEIFKFFKKVMPGLKNMGVIYQPANEVSSMEIKTAQELLDKENTLGINLIVVKIDKANDLGSATNTLIEKKVEAIWIPHDRLVDKNLDIIKAIASPNKIPILLSTITTIAAAEKTAMAGIVINYRGLGKLSVPIADKILTQGTNPKDIPIGTMQGRRVLINLKAAKEIDYEIPLSVLATADKIIE